MVKQFSDHIGDQYPSILVLKSWDANENKTLDSVEVIKYSKKEYKLDELKEFLTPLARWAKKEQHHKKEDKKDDGETSE